MKRILITGANKGIGLAVASALLSAHDDVRVILGSRDAARGHAAVASLVARDATFAGRLSTVALDVTSDASVVSAAALVAAGGGLYALIANAGIAVAPTLELFDVNVRGVKRCIDAFTPLLGIDGVVVAVSSGSASMFIEKCVTRERRDFFRAGAAHSWEVLEAALAEYVAAASAGDGALASLGYAPATPMGPYGLSKALLNCLVARTAATTRLRINACSPGFIETDLTRAFVPAGKTPADLGALPVTESTRAIVKLCVLGGAALPGGGRGLYFGSDGERSPIGRYRAPGTAPYEGGEEE